MAVTTESQLPPGGPFFDDLSVGMRVSSAPSVSLTSGLAAVHQSILGDRLRLCLDHELVEAVTGRGGLLAHPALVWDVSIGQSTLLTRRVKANLFYRGLAFRQTARIGDTLQTTSEVVALKQNRHREGREATGMAVIRVLTTDHRGDTVLDFWRCAMLPLRNAKSESRHDDDFAAVPTELDLSPVLATIETWNLRALPTSPSAVDQDLPSMAEGMTWSVDGGDVVSSAPELARLTLNVASVHQDETVSGRRLVYGGHTIGIATHQLARLLPSLVTVLAWQSCDHTGPVFEGDTLFSTVTLERLVRLPAGGVLAHLRSRVRAHRTGESEPIDVLDWRLIAVLA